MNNAMFSHYSYSADFQDNFYALCKSGETGWRNATLDAALKCQLQNFGQPYLRLGPFKIEEKSKNPFMVIFHDFLSEAETTLMTDIDKDRLKRSMMADPTVKQSKIRTSKQVCVILKCCSFVCCHFTNYSGVDR